MKKIVIKKDIFLLIGIILYSIIMCHVFLRVRYSSDAYCLMYRGYFDYPVHYFLLDGRIIASIICYVSGLLKLQYNVYFIIMDFLGIIILSISVFILYKYLSKILKFDGKLYKILLLLASQVTIINHISIEYLLYPESGVMCLGILFCVLASITYSEVQNKKLIKTCILVLLATLCYQGILNLFPILTLSIFIIKNYNEKNSLNKSIKNYITIITKLGIIFCFALIISYGLCLIAETIIGDSNFHIRSSNITSIKNKLYEGIFKNFNLLPNYLNFIIIFITSLIILQYSENKNLIIQYILICFTAYLFVFLPIFVWGYVMARMAIAIGALMGISLIFCLLLIKNNDKKHIKEIIISIFIFSYFLFNTFNFMVNANEHYKAYQKDVELGNEINKRIIEYENTTGNVVTKMDYGYDKNPNFYTNGIKNKGPLTERKFSLFYCIVEATNFYCNKNFELKKEDYLSDYICEHYFYGIDYDSFSDTQILFEGDTMYFLIY